MKCYDCKKEIAGGVTRKVVFYYLIPPDFTVEFRHSPFDGTGPPPPGSRLLRGGHYKCDQARIKKARRAGRAQMGGGIGMEVPTAYNIVASTMNADDLAAAGITPEMAAEMSTVEMTRRIEAHRKARLARIRARAETLAVEALEETLAARNADPGYHPPDESDWRDQTTVEVGDLVPTPKDGE